jgi:hypothetical protein
MLNETSGRVHRAHAVGLRRLTARAAAWLGSGARCRGLCRGRGLACLAVAVAFAVVGVSVALAVPVPVWQSASEVTLPAHATNPAASLGSVACASAGNCVAVGYYADASADQQALVVGESGGMWGSGSEVTSPAGHATSPDAYLNSVACPSAGNCVAVGGYEDSSSHEQAMVVVESGGVWGSASPVTLPSHATNPEAALNAVSCASAGNCVAVGSYYDNSSNEQAMVVAESGGVWGTASEVTLPGGHATNPDAYLDSVVCSSVGNCAAAGDYNETSSSEAMVVVQSGGAWGSASEVTPPAGHATDPYANVNSLACASAGNCVAVGTYDDASTYQEAMVVPDSGGVWGTASEVTLPAHATNPQAFLQTVACGSVGNCVGVGGYKDGSSYPQAMLVGESGGVWGTASEVTLPAHATDPYAVLNAVACPSVGNCVAAGNYADASSDQQAMVVAESGGVWGSASEVTLPAGHATNAGPGVNSLACGSVGSCVGVGQFQDASSHEQVMTLGSVPSLSVLTSGLPSAAVGAAYSAQLSASGGAGSYTWSVSSGSLPAGLSLNAATGVISGTPTGVGTASFTVSVSDPGPPGQQASAALSIAVGGPSITKVKTDGAKLMVTLSCGAAAGLTCTGTLALTAVEHLKGHKITAITASKKPKKPRRTTRAITLANASYTIAGATTKTLTLTLNTTARRLLAKRHKLPAEITTTPTGLGTPTTTADITIKPSKPKPKRHRH